MINERVAEVQTKNNIEIPDRCQSDLKTCWFYEYEKCWLYQEELDEATYLSGRPGKPDFCAATHITVHSRYSHNCA